jgi:hypothetical protein
MTVMAEETTETCRAAAHMAHLLFADLEIDLRPSQIEDFIQKRWARIAPLAHAIHGRPDDTKETVSTTDYTVKLSPEDIERMDAAQALVRASERVRQAATSYGRAMADEAVRIHRDQYPTNRVNETWGELVSALRAMEGQS